MLKVRKGSGEEIPLIQGKEQWLRFAGAAVKSQIKLYSLPQHLVPRIYWPLIPRTGEPDGLPSMGSHRVRHD